MKFEIYPDRSGQTRWRLKAKNGKIVADSGEAYNSVANARRAIKSFRHLCYEAPVVIVEPAEAEPTAMREGKK